MARDKNLALIQGGLPAEVSRRIQAGLIRQSDEIQAIAAIGMEGMDAIAEVQTYAAWKVALAAAATEVAARSSTPAGTAVQQMLFENFANRLSQITDLTDIKIIQTVDEFTSSIHDPTFADALEGVKARIQDALLGRPGGNHLELPEGR
jgi:hypothetical protein